MHDVTGREKKAKTMVAVLEDYYGDELKNKSVLNVGGSAGIIDNLLSQHVSHVTGIDIDKGAIATAKKSYARENLVFKVGDALNIEFADSSFDVVVCSQVYEHVPDAGKMMAEIYRVLKPSGVCYFAAGNRLSWREPHHKLPLLSVIPRPFAHIYMRLSGKGQFYYEKHLSVWGLRSLTSKFRCIDYTVRMIESSVKFKVDYMLRPEAITTVIAKIVGKYFYWAVPGYIWLLVKE